MEYHVIFDVATKGFPWSGWAIPFCGSLIGVVLLARAIRAKRKIPIMTLLVALWFTGISIFAVWMYLRERTALIDALHNGRVLVVEGRVHSFKPGRAMRGSTIECFSVDSQRFCYSEYSLGPAFNDTAAWGGPIRDGLQLRLHHRDRAIVRLEVPRHSAP